MTHPELKPCPFCGGEAFVAARRTCEGHGENHNYIFVKCKKCGANTPGVIDTYSTTEIAAIYAARVWNRREGSTSKAAMEVFVDLDRLMLDGAIGGKYPAKVINPNKYAELKKKYAERDEPLTLDELAQMKSEPVWVQSPGVPEYGRWAIVEGVSTADGDKILFLHDDFTCHEYGRVWLAYRHKQNAEPQN